MTEIQQWLIDFFSSRVTIPGDTLEQKLKVNYIETQLLDSLDMVELLETIEHHFSIRFRSNHMQDPRFRIIRGLAEIIDEATGERSA
jgi:acyl carrier protein